MVFRWFKKKKKPEETPSDGSSAPAPDETHGSRAPVAEDTSAPDTAGGADDGPGPEAPAPDDDVPDAEIPPLDDPMGADVPQSVGTPVITAQTTAQPDERSTPEKEKAGFLKRLRKGLTKTREILTTDIDKLFVGKRAIDEDFLEELEELLITSDVGVQTAMALMDSVSKKSSIISDANALKAALKEDVVGYLKAYPKESRQTTAKPHVVLVLGVNGVGKTTTIGKLAAKAAKTGKKVMIAAADTFRAAAIEQISIWADRAGAEIVKHRENADPSAVVWDCMEAAVARNVDLVLIDTAGRLHTRVNLMEELKKIKRTISKKMPEAPHETLLVLDATTGQNALSQAKMFNEALGITGMALTKLDGTAKGGIVVSICTSLNIPLSYIGVGEQIEDLQEFDPQRFVEALF